MKDKSLHVVSNTKNIYDYFIGEELLLTVKLIKSEMRAPVQIVNQELYSSLDVETLEKIEHNINGLRTSLLATNF